MTNAKVVLFVASAFLLSVLGFSSHMLRAGGGSHGRSATLMAQLHPVAETDGASESTVLASAAERANQYGWEACDTKCYKGKLPASEVLTGLIGGCIRNEHCADSRSDVLSDVFGACTLDPRGIGLKVGPAASKTELLGSLVCDTKCVSHKDPAFVILPSVFGACICDGPGGRCYKADWQLFQWPFG